MTTKPIIDRLTTLNSRSIVRPRNGFYSPAAAGAPGESSAHAGGKQWADFPLNMSMSALDSSGLSIRTSGSTKHFKAIVAIWGNTLVFANS